MVKIEGVEAGSPAERAGIKTGDQLLKINGHTIIDVLDYRFYAMDKNPILTLEDGRELKLKKPEYEDIGLIFSSYLMDEQRSCRNKCMFCFIDQLPKGLRQSLYFKDDDSRLSFLFGNYITLTNITEHEVKRIISMHISPINISVHTTNKQLRCKIMNNRFAGDVLKYIYQFNDAGIKLNCQNVLMPGINDGAELESTLSELLSLKNVQCIASVPVGLTKYREGLTPLRPFTKEEARRVIEITESFNDDPRRAYASDEFFLKSGLPLPEKEYYGDFLQLENGVGMYSLFRSECLEALENFGGQSFSMYDDMPDNVNLEGCAALSNPAGYAGSTVRHDKCGAVFDNTAKSVNMPSISQKSVATGAAAFPLVRNIVDKAAEKWHNFNCNVFEIKNEFFGENITVSGLITGGDIIKQLKGKNLGELLILPENMLRAEKDMFLDDITVERLEKELGVEVRFVGLDGYDFIDTLAL